MPLIPILNQANIRCYNVIKEIGAIIFNRFIESGIFPLTRTIPPFARRNIEKRSRRNY